VQRPARPAATPATPAATQTRTRVKPPQ
jgi:hypothetical protein